MTPRNLVFIFLVIFSLFESCTYTTTTKKSPIFKVDTETLSRKLLSLIVTEEVNLQGTEKKRNAKSESDLTVRLINSINAPSNEDDRYKLGKLIAIQIKQLLKDQNEYDTFTVLFVTQVVNGAVTKNNYTGQVYKSSDL